MATVRVRYEQAVYGSFPFWDKGYAVLAQSPGCQPEWVADLRAACQKYGEPPRGMSPEGAFFSLRLPSGPWVVVRVSSPGADDQGRPGALSFHALFLDQREFRKVRFNPFPLLDLFQESWGPTTTALPSGDARAPRPDVPEDDGSREVRWLSARLRNGQRAVCEAGEPINGLACQVWNRLPTRKLRRLSLATLAFGNGNEFDLLAVPKISAATLDSSYAALPDGKELEDAIAEKHGRARFSPASRLRWEWAGVLGAVLGMAFLATLGLSRTWHTGAAVTHAPALPAQIERVPDRAAYRERIQPDEQARIVEGLLDLTERVGLSLPARKGGENEATALMRSLAQRLRYEGPRLAEAEVARLSRDPSREARRALACHNQVSRFVGDRPLPAEFGSGPLRWQLDTLCWSFHVEPDPRLSAAEVPHRLAAALSVEGSLRLGPLAGRYPALASYAAFLERLRR